MRIIIIFISLLYFFNGYSESIVGNGGYSVTCTDKSSFSYQLLDLFEGLNNYNLSYVELDKNPQVRMNNLFYLIKKEMPNRYEKYLQWYKNFYLEIYWVDKDVILDPKDYGSVLLPVGCKIESVITQVDNRFRSHPFYFVDRSRFNKLSEGHKIALILHEILFREASQFNVDQSLGIRRLNGIILSDQFLAISPKDLREYFLKYGFVDDALLE